MYQPEKLKARRKELKLTQKDIADQLGISYQAYSAWERGIKQPSREKIKLLELPGQSQNRSLCNQSNCGKYQKDILQRLKLFVCIIHCRIKVKIK